MIKFIKGSLYKVYLEKRPYMSDYYIMKYNGNNEFWYKRIFKYKQSNLACTLTDLYSEEVYNIIDIKEC